MSMVIDDILAEREEQFYEDDRFGYLLEERDMEALAEDEYWAERDTAELERGWRE